MLATLDVESMNAVQDRGVYLQTLMLNSSRQYAIVSSTFNAKLGPWTRSSTPAAQTGVDSGDSDGTSYSVIRTHGCKEERWMEEALDPDEALPENFPTPTLKPKFQAVRTRMGNL